MALYHVTLMEWWSVESPYAGVITRETAMTLPRFKREARFSDEVRWVVSLRVERSQRGRDVDLPDAGWAGAGI
ncbi:MAG: hypothetical protein AAGE59_30720 [Cyanobacteria bacterium P01_F01_bin.86]